MLRRAFLQALGVSAATGLPGIAHARPMPPPEGVPDTRPITLDNPRVWPPASRDAPLLLDDQPLIQNVQQAFGMVRADASRSVRPIFRVFQAMRRELASTRRAQLIDEGVQNRVYLEQPTLARRVCVVWSAGPQPRDAVLTALGPSAQVMDRFGALQPIAVGPDGHISVTLAGATANTVPGFPQAYFIGGEPRLILEPLTDDYKPLAPTYANLPPPGQPW